MMNASESRTVESHRDQSGNSEYDESLSPGKGSSTDSFSTESIFTLSLVDSFHFINAQQSPSKFDE
jgi:hypothetical protein